MASLSAESFPAVEDQPSANDYVNDSDTERPPKLSGRKKILKSLQRISSTPSVARLRSNSANQYRGTGKGSISCISLSSSSYGYGLGTALPTPFTGYSTAPTSVPTTPGIETDAYGKVRFVDGVRPADPNSVGVPLEARSRPATSSGIPTIEEDYFSQAFTEKKERVRRPNFDFWGDMPTEIKFQILRLLAPREIVQCSVVSRSWHRTCFDGQLWANMDTTDFYSDIPAEGLVKIIKNAGPFVKDLNLRGCVQLWECWRATGLSDACRNLENLSLEGCRIDRNSIHTFMYQNTRLVHINVSGLTTVDNSTMRIIAQACPRIKVLNISWCNKVSTRGLRRVFESCPSLRDLRAGEVSGCDNVEFMTDLFRRNNLERLILANCDSLTDESFRALIEGDGEQIDYLTGRKVVPPRTLRHLDISKCRNITDDGLMSLVGNMPFLEGLQLAKCRNLTDSSLIAVLPTMPSLTHLDLEELETLTNESLIELAKSPCAPILQHLSISYCENLGDAGMLPVVKACSNLRNLDLDNTRISDLVLAEAAAMVRQRSSPLPVVNRPRAITWDGGSAPRSTSIASGPAKPKVGLRMVVYDCQNVTWTGIREVLSRNAEIRRPMPPSFFLPSFAPATIATSHTQAGHPAATGEHDPSYRTTTLQTLQTQTQTAPSHPHHVISLKVFYGYQPTVTEHTRRVLRGDLASASRLERKWAEYMMASEEAGAAMGVGTGNGLGRFGAVNGLGNATVNLGMLGNRRRRRRVREAQMMHADEEEGGMGLPGGVGRRRRARSRSGCAMM